MKAIWKFNLQLRESQIIEMPNGATILSVQMQGDKIQLWALVKYDPDMPPGSWQSSRKFRIAGTGRILPEGNFSFAYIGTVQQGEYVWHIFEEHEEVFAEEQA